MKKKKIIMFAFLGVLLIIAGIMVFYDLTGTLQYDSLLSRWEFYPEN